MFGFIYKIVDTTGYQLTRDGQSKYLKNVCDSGEAHSRYQSFEDYEMELVTFKFHISKVRIKVPLLKGEVITPLFNRYLLDNKYIGAIAKSCWSKFLKQYDVVKDGKGRVGFSRKKTFSLDYIPQGVLLNMKNFIEGLFMLEPIEVYSGKDKAGKDKYMPMPNLPVDIINGEYEIGGEKFTTNVFGVYAPVFRQLMFGGLMDFGNGRIVQKRQLQLLYQLGLETYLAASRQAGKSIIAGSLVSIFLCRTLISPREKLDGMIVHVYGLSHASNRGIINKILKLNKKLKKGDIFKYNVADKTLTFFSGGESVGYVEFLSDESKEPGRGGSPKFIIGDEAARLSQNIPDIASGHSMAPKLWISTIDYNTKKNWFYEGLMRSELEMNIYKETMDELVHRLWTKYGLDKINNIEDLDHKKIIEMREEFYSERPRVGMRFTLDDVEYKSEKEKQMIINQKLEQRGMQFLLAEEFSEFLDDNTVFNIDGIVHSDFPTHYGQIFIGVDQASNGDNATLCALGVTDTNIYTIESLILSKDEFEQKDQIKKKLIEYKKISDTQRISGLTVDCTQAPEEQRYALENRGIIPDRCVQITNGGNSKVNTKGFTVIGKELLVKVAKEMFDRKIVSIHEKLNVEKGLLEELTNYSMQVNPATGRAKYMALKGKDDQVTAMMLALYEIYESGFKNKLAEQDNRQETKQTMSQEEMVEYIKRKNKAKEENEEMGSLEELLSRFGY